MPTKNGRVNRGLGWTGIGGLVGVIIFYFAVIDRAETSGVEKATVKKDVEAVTERVIKLEDGAESTHKMLHGEGLDDGLVSTVGKIKLDVGYMKEDIGEIRGAMKGLNDQGKIILEELRKIK